MWLRLATVKSASISIELIFTVAETTARFPMPEADLIIFEFCDLGRLNFLAKERSIEDVVAPVSILARIFTRFSAKEISTASTNPSIWRLAISKLIYLVLI